MKTKPLTYNRAVDLMRGGARLTLMHAADGLVYYVVPGGKVAADTAKKIKQHPLVRSCKDGLFPGHAQTWTISQIVEVDVRGPLDELDTVSLREEVRR
jgi:hypothetical protein